MGLWQIYMSAGSQLATQTLLLEQDRTWHLAGNTARHTLPAAAGAGCWSGTLWETVRENITWMYFQLSAVIIPMCQCVLSLHCYIENLGCDDIVSLL